MSNSNKSNEEIPSVFQTIEDIVIKYLYSLEGHNLQFNLPGLSEPLVEHFPAHIIFWLYRDVYYEMIGRTTTSPFGFLIMQLLSLQIRTLTRGKEKPIIFEKVPELHRHITQVSYSDAAAYFRQKYNLFETYTFQELANQSSWTPALLKTYRKVAITLSRSHHSGR